MIFLKFKKMSKKTKRNLKKFKSAKFNYAKFVKNYYIDKGVAYISAKVNSIDDIISKYSIKNYEWINSDFANYLEESAYYIPMEESITIEICGGNFSEDQKDLITRVIKDYFGLQLGDKIMDLDINKKRSNILLGFSFFGVLLVAMLNRFDIIGTVAELFIFILWFFLWEYGEMAFLDRSELQEQKLEAAQLSTAKIVFLDEEINSETKKSKEKVLS